jgi:hypothetical protein
VLALSYSNFVLDFANRFAVRSYIVGFIQADWQNGDPPPEVLTLLNKFWFLSIRGITLQSLPSPFATNHSVVYLILAKMNLTGNPIKFPRLFRRFCYDRFCLNINDMHSSINPFKRKNNDEVQLINPALEVESGIFYLRLKFDSDFPEISP